MIIDLFLLDRTTHFSSLMPAPDKSYLNLSLFIDFYCALFFI